MPDYSVSGDFGKVKYYTISVPTNRFISINHVISFGWHKVNSLYQIKRPKGFYASLLLFTVSGKGNVQIGNKKYQVKSGDLTLLPKDIPHAYGGRIEDEWEFFWIHYDGKTSDLITEDIIRNNRYNFDIGVSEIEYLLSPLIHNCNANNVENELIEGETLQNILNLLLKKSVAWEIARKHSPLLLEIMHFLDEYEDNEFSLDKLVDKYHYSKEYIIRAFKDNFAISPYQYWLVNKLKRSCVDLQDSIQSIEEIAQKYGYKNVASYSKQFKKQFNISPVQYRNLFSFFNN